MAVVLVVTAVVFVALIVIIGAALGPIAAVVLVEPVLLAAALLLAGWLTRERLQAWTTLRLARMAGPAIVHSIPPRLVLDALLDRLFGKSFNHEAITTALLGGGGSDLDGRDTAVSSGTTVDITLNRVTELDTLVEMRWSHTFPKVRNSHRLVMFATSDSEIFTLLTARRVYPLFESWLVQNEDELEGFVPGIEDRLEVGIDYRDADGFVHRVEPRAEQGEEVALQDFDQYVRLPARVDPKELRIFQLDLHDLADADHVVVAVERLFFQASTAGIFDLGYLKWSAPYPCFVETVTFDVKNLALAGEQLVYLIVAGSLEMPYLPMRGAWKHVSDKIEISFHSWMLPGHGVTLLWRPIDGAE
jgi:hypothetical protein